MRRFEFSEGGSSKFWSAGVEDNKFIVVYGKIGTEGKREEKIFPNEAAAKKELDKKLAEKVKKGYAEVAAGATAPAAEPEKKEPEAPKKPEFPARYAEVKASADKVSEAITALEALQKSLGKRSWQVTHQTQKTLRALEAIAGYKASAPKNFANTFEDLMKAVIAPEKDKRLPLRHAFSLLSKLDDEAFVKALSLWKDAPKDSPAAATIAAITKQNETLADAEVTLRLGAFLADRTSSEAAFTKRWKAFKPHFEAFLTFKGENPKGYTKGIDAAGDKLLAKRISEMK
jgi:predicted DNA-binding WGR domain protein